MSIDKFGRILKNEENSGVSLPTQHSGVGLSVTTDGDFSAQQKRIKDILTPVDPKDAVNVEYVTRKTNSCMKLKIGGYFDARKSYIRNVKDPVENDDAVTKQYLQSLIPIKLQDSYSLGNLKLQDVAFPTNPGDGVNLAYITNHCVKYKNGVIDGNNLIIKHIKDGSENSDAATVGYVIKAMEEYAVTVEKQLRNLGSALFHYIHRSAGRASQAGVTGSNYLDWDKIIS